MSRNQKIWIFGGVGLVVVVAAVLVVISLRSQASSSSSTYQTTTVQQGTLTSTVEGTGTVGSTQSTTLAWQVGGQVVQVKSKIGDQVKNGDILASLELSAKDQNSLLSALMTAQSNLSQLTSSEAIANAKLAVTTDEKNVINSQIGLNNTQYWKNDALIKFYYAKFVIAKDSLDQAQTAYDNANVGDYINNANEANAYEALYGAQQAYDKAWNLYSLYAQKPTQRQMDEAQATLDLAKATLVTDQAYLTALTGGTIPADTTDINLLKLEQAKLAVQTAQDNLDQVNITAPFDGTITQSDVNLGDVVSSGASAFRLDNLSSLVVDVPVTEIDINSIQNGQPATITFDAIPNKTYNALVSKNSLAGTTGSNSVNFTIEVLLSDADSLIKPGMVANVTIITNQVANALLVPSTAIFTDTNGKSYVYLVQNGTPQIVYVTVGASSSSNSQITSNNLQAGDTIVLSFATSNSSLQGGGFGMFGGGSVRNQQPAGTP